MHWRIQGGRHGRAPPGPKFFHFHAVFGGKLAKIIGWRPHLCGWNPLLWEILDPPLLMVCILNDKEYFTHFAGNLE